VTHSQPNPKPVTPAKPRRPNDALLQAMSEAAKLPTETLARRAEIRKPKDPEYIPSEVLVHRMRDLHRAGNQADFNRLARPFVTRATAMLRKRAAGINDADFEDFAHRVLRAVFTELLSSADDYTFYEVAFNRIFRFRRLDAYGQWLAEKRARETGEDEDASDDRDPGEGFETAESLPEHAPEWEFDPMRELMKQEERNRAFQRMEEAGLTEREKVAYVLSDVFEWQIDSDDNDEKTIAKYLGVTGRTVQNLISRARLKLSGKE